MSDILDDIPSYFRENSEIMENASMGGVSASAIPAGGMGRNTSKSSIFIEKKSPMEKMGKKWAKAMKKGKYEKAQNISDEVKNMKEGMFDAVPKGKSKGALTFGDPASKKIGTSMGVPPVAKIKEERFGSNANKEMKTMKKFVGEAVPVASPMEKLCGALVKRVIQRFGGKAGSGGEFRFSDPNYSVPVIIHPDVGGSLTLILSAFEDGSYCYNWYVGNHGLNVSELDRADQIGGQHLYGGPAGHVSVMLKDIEENLAEFTRRYEQHEMDMRESYTVGDKLSWTDKGIFYEGRITSVYGNRAVVTLGDGGLDTLFGTSKVAVDLSKLNEARTENYHSVFQLGDDGKWGHHFDADNLEDANDELRGIRNQGGKGLRLVVPKEQARWHEVDVDSYVRKALDRKRRQAR